MPSKPRPNKAAVVNLRTHSNPYEEPGDNYVFSGGAGAVRRSVIFKNAHETAKQTTGGSVQPDGRNAYTGASGERMRVVKGGSNRALKKNLATDLKKNKDN